MNSKVSFCFVIILISIFSSNLLLAHCDTMDGPVVADARKAINLNNVNYVLKWIKPDKEKELIEAFNLIMKIRELSPEAKELADKYFFETLVRLHRSGEGEAFTGVKPSGTPIDDRIIAADKSIELGDLSPLIELVPKVIISELKRRFDKVMSLKNFDVNNVDAGREYIEAYVQFFHYAEGEAKDHAISPLEKSGHFDLIIPWTLTGIFLILSIIFAILYIRRKETIITTK